MARYIFMRLITMLVVAWVIVTLTFFMMRALPGGPFAQEKAVPDVVLRALNHKYHLDLPLWKQYTEYLAGVVRWDLGPSFRFQGRTVNDFINRGFPVSAAIGGASVLLSLLLGLPLGILAAMRHNGLYDRTVSALAIFTASAPSFIIAAALQFFLAYRWKFFPSAGFTSSRHMVLPVIALCSFSLAWVVKLTRSTMLEVTGQDYIRTARSKGIPSTIIVYRHMLKNAMIPVIASVAPLTAGILVGSFVVETVFNIPGIGRDFVTSIANRDYTVTLGMTVFFGLLLTGFTLIGDILTALIDPRVRLEKEG